MRWSYFPCLSIFILALFLQNHVYSFPSSGIGSSDLEQHLNKRHSIGSNVVFVKRAFESVKKLFGGGKPTTPKHTPKPGYFDPASAHEPAPLRKGTILKEGYQLPAHMKSPPRSTDTKFDPKTRGPIGPGVTKPKGKGK